VTHEQRLAEIAAARRKRRRGNPPPVPHTIWELIAGGNWYLPLSWIAAGHN
jgi:hypothetical protein